MDILPIELLHVIASFDISAYRALLSIPFFARSLNPSIRTDYKISFGYSVKIFHDRIQWYRNGKYHREDGPAIEYSNGGKEWFRNGKYHREDGPAIDYNMRKEWWLNGKYHRENGPAIEYPDGTKEWYLNGELHRENGPAIEWSDGIKHWYRNGKRHRDYGPAIECTEGTEYWYYNGIFIGSDENFVVIPFIKEPIYRRNL